MNTSGAVIAAFSEEQVERLTGVRQAQLRYWDRTGFFSSSFPDRDWGGTFGCVYSFRDIVSLRVLGVLRNQYMVPLQHLRQVSAKLSHLAEDRWTGVRLYVLNRRVVWEDPGSSKPQDLITAQYVLPTIQLEAVASQTKRDIHSLNERAHGAIGHVERSRAVNHNDAVIAGTRIRVRTIQRFSEAGYSVEQILAEYPDLKEDDIKAALQFGETSP